MLQENENDQAVSAATDEIELTEFVKPLETEHHDLYAQYGHGLPQDAAEASTRALMRDVLLAYGALLGGLADNMMLGISAGLALGMAFDLYMGNRSMVRSPFRRMHLWVTRDPGSSPRRPDFLERSARIRSLTFGAHCGANPG